MCERKGSLQNDDKLVTMTTHSTVYTHHYEDELVATDDNDDTETGRAGRGWSLGSRSRLMS